MFFSPTLEKTVKINGLSHYPYRGHTNTGTASQVPYTQLHTYTHIQPTSETHTHTEIYPDAYLEMYTLVHAQECAHTGRYTHRWVLTQYTQRSICNPAHMEKLIHTQVYPKVHTPRKIGRVDTQKCTYKHTVQRSCELHFSR